MRGCAGSGVLAYTRGSSGTGEFMLNLGCASRRTRLSTSSLRGHMSRFRSSSQCASSCSTNAESCGVFIVGAIASTCAMALHTSRRRCTSVATKPGNMRVSPTQNAHSPNSCAPAHASRIDAQTTPSRQNQAEHLSKRSSVGSSSGDAGTAATRDMSAAYICIRCHSSSSPSKSVSRSDAPPTGRQVRRPVRLAARRDARSRLA